MNFETLLGIQSESWVIAALAFLRVVSILVFLPIFGNSATPVRVRILFALVFTFAVWPLIENDVRMRNLADGLSPTGATLIALKEVFLGFSIGFSTKLLMYAANIAAGLVGINMGFSTAFVFNPQVGTQDSVLGIFKNWLIIMIILFMNLHHYFIQTIYDSYRDIPLSPTIDPTLLMTSVTHVVATSFEIGLRIAAPLLSIQMVTTFILGLLGRTIPQLNIFIINFPASYLLSMVILFLGTASIVTYLARDGVTREYQATERTLESFRGRN